MRFRDRFNIPGPIFIRTGDLTGQVIDSGSIEVNQEARWSGMWPDGSS
jgi:hypothetical protein